MQQISSNPDPIVIEFDSIDAGGRVELTTSGSNPFTAQIGGTAEGFIEGDFIEIFSRSATFDIIPKVGSDITVVQHADGSPAAMPANTHARLVLVNRNGSLVWELEVSATMLESLKDVQIAGPVLNEVLTFDGTNWVNLAAPVPAMTLDDLTNVTAPAPSTGEVLTFNGTDWVNLAAPSLALTGLTDVTVVDPNTSDVLTFNGSTWAASAPPTAAPILVCTLSGGGDNSYAFDGTKQIATSGQVIISSADATLDESFNIVLGRDGYYRVTIGVRINPYSPTTWPDNLTAFGSAVDGGTAVGPALSRHSTWADADPMDFTGISSNLGNAPDPEAAKFMDEYIISGGIDSTFAPKIYAANYSAQFATFATNYVVTVQWIGPL